MAETVFAPEATWSGEMNPEELEQRIQRIEEAVAGLCSTSVSDVRLRDAVVREVRAELERMRGHPGNRLSVEQAAETNAAEKPSLGTGIPAKTKLPFLWEIWSDVTLLIRMIRDPYYFMSWSAKTIPLFALAYVTVLPILTGWMPSWPAVPVLSHLDDLIVIYIGFKVLGRELRLYREHLDARGLS